MIRIPVGAWVPLHERNGSNRMIQTDNLPAKLREMALAATDLDSYSGIEVAVWRWGGLLNG